MTPCEDHGHTWNYLEQITGYLSTRWCPNCGTTEYSEDDHRWFP